MDVQQVGKGILGSANKGYLVIMYGTFSAYVLFLLKTLVPLDPFYYP